MRVRRRVNVPTGTNNQQAGTRDTTPRHRDGDAGTINTRPRTWRETAEAVMEAIADVGFCDVRLERGEKCSARSIFEGNQRGGAWQDPWAGATSFFRHDSADSERGQLGAKKGVKKSTRVVFDTKTKATAGLQSNDRPYTRLLTPPLHFLGLPRRGVSRAHRQSLSTSLAHTKFFLGSSISPSFSRLPETSRSSQMLALYPPSSS